MPGLTSSNAGLYKPSELYLDWQFNTQYYPHAAVAIIEAQIIKFTNFRGDQ